MLKKCLLSLLLLLAGTWLYAQTDTVSVYFAFNDSRLSEETKFLIDSSIYRGTIPMLEPVQIIGYTDAVGKDTFNLSLSRRRAASVKSYLIESGLSAEHITLIVGKGESLAKMPERPGGSAEDRRVDIVRLMPKASPRAIDFGRIKVVENVAMPLPVPSLSTEPRKASTTDISTIAIGETIVLDNIYFYAGKHIVRKESYAALDSLVQSLKDHPEINIRIEGHVCCVPDYVRDAIDDQTGQEELSVNRALAIRDYLVSHGVAAERLSYMGFGRKRPLIPFERNEADANRNRRVEIRVVK